jgi:hypothetical protein
MALTVTPGGAADDSLLTLADFETYCTAYGHDVSSYTDAAKEVALRRGTLWVEGIGARGATRTYRWPGTRATSTQARAHPRTGALRPDGTSLSSTVIWPEVGYAVAEVAVYDLANPTALFTVVTPAAIRKHVKVGEIEVEYFKSQRWEDARPMLTAVSDLLSDILIPERVGKSAELFAVGRGTINWE